MATSPVKIAGVPEAFNDCWATADFASRNLTSPPEFHSHPGGSGSMLKSVQSGSVDAAFALTDCIVAAIENGAPVRLAGPLVISPLTWAVIVAPGSKFGNVADLGGATWGVSRMGSGSQVMVQVLAKEKGWEGDRKFEVCGNFDGLREAVSEGRVDAFLWEFYTTRPYEVKGEVRILGGVPTPWGCFSVVVRMDCGRVAEIRKVVDAFLEAGGRFKKGEETVEGIVERYGMSAEDAEGWLNGVKYADAGVREVEKEELEMTRRVLKEAGVIKEYLCPGGMNGYYV